MLYNVRGNSMRNTRANRRWENSCEQILHMDEFQDGKQSITEADEHRKWKKKKTKQSDKAQGESPKLGHCYRTDKNRCRCQYTCKCVQMTLTIRFSLYFDLSGEGEEDGAAKTACTLSDDRRINAINELPNFIFVLILLSFLFNVCLCLTCAFVRSAFIPDQSQSQTETRKKIVGQ